MTRSYKDFQRIGRRITDLICEFSGDRNLNAEVDTLLRLKGVLNRAMNDAQKSASWHDRPEPLRKLLAHATEGWIEAERELADVSREAVDLARQLREARGAQ